MIHRFSCFKAYGIFLAQGLNPWLLHWQTDSLPLSQQGNPKSILWNRIFRYFEDGKPSPERGQYFLRSHSKLVERGKIQTWDIWLYYSTVVVQLPSCVPLFLTPWTTTRQASLSLSISWSLPKFMFIASVMPSSHLILSRPLLLLPSIFPGIRDFSNELFVCIRWLKYWSFSFSISPSSEYQDWSPLRLTGLIYYSSPFLKASDLLRTPLEKEGASCASRHPEPGWPWRIREC